METILIVDDEKDLVNIISDTLVSNNYKILKAYNGFEAIEMAKYKPDLILLDVMMPDIDGYDVIRSIRDRVSCPIIFLSAKDDEMDIIKGLALGGDDYLSKPFSLKELIFRIKAHLRRENREVTPSNTIRYNNLTIDLKGYIVKVDERVVPLTKTEFSIVELLSLNPGQVFPKELIYEKIWGFNGESDLSTITEHIKKIRAKFHEIDNSINYIKTVWGIGYKWEDL